MGARRPTYILVAGFLVSLGLHATLLIPALVGVMNEGTAHERLQARFSPEDFMRAEDEEPPPEEDQTQLGIDDGSPSTLTWIGYDQYEEHLARLAEVEQAAFRDSVPGSQAPPAQTAGQAPAEPKEAADRKNADSQDAEDALAEIEQWLQAQRTGEGPQNPASPSLDLPRQRALKEALDKIEEMMEKPAEPAEPQDQAAPSEAPDQPAQPEAQPNEDDSPGDVAQKESDATSTIEVRMDQLQYGKPLAARGLEIMTHKPQLTSLVMLTAAPANPRVELRFLSTGKPAKCRILESSGDPRIDEAILNSLYRWRARGKELVQLKRGETVPIRIRILINARR